MSVQVPVKPIASAPGDHGTSLEVFALQRDGKSSVTLILAVHNVGTSTYIPNTDEFSEPHSQDYDVSGFTLFDPAAMKRYLVYRDAPDTTNSSGGRVPGGRCLCSNLGVGLNRDIDSGQSSVFAAEFPAPPAGTKLLTIQTSIGSVPSVPLSG